MAKNYDVNETAENMWETAKEKVKDGVAKGGEQMSQSGKDWLDYVETHPMQTLIFGVIGFFALKGLFK